MKTTFVLLACLLLALHLVPCFAQAQPPRRTNPLHPDTGAFVVAGQMVGSLGRGEGLGDNVYPIDDCNKDGLNDWLVERLRTDIVLQHFEWEEHPREVLLYLGQQSVIPDIADYKRIGETKDVVDEIVAAGDFDADSFTDIVIKRFTPNDSTYGTGGSTQYDLIVFWGDRMATYSEGDTTHLMPGTDAWGVICYGVATDWNNDDIDDLFIHTCGANAPTGRKKGGGSEFIPTVHVFVGARDYRRLKENDSRRADWTWWYPPSGRVTKKFDIDCDDVADILFVDNREATGSIAVIYGMKSDLYPDTNNVEIMRFDSVDGKSSLLVDVTKDNVLDFVLLAGRFETQRIMVWPGEPGKRLSEILFRTDDDSLVWREPWASIPTPNALHDGWGDLGYRLYDLGDANLDGYNDIWAYTGILFADFVICYSTGLFLDSLIDGIYRMDGLSPKSFAKLGDVDGSGIPTIAMGYLNFNGNETGIIYFKPTTEIPFTGKFRPLPHPRDVQRCFSTVSVASRESRDASEKSLGLRVIPNPASGEVRVLWRQGESARVRNGEAVVTVHDAVGREVSTFHLPVETTEAVWNASAVAAGMYFITARIGDLSETLEVIIE